MSTVQPSSNLPANTSKCYPQLDFRESNVVEDFLENDISLDQEDSVPFDHILASNTFQYSSLCFAYQIT